MANDSSSKRESWENEILARHRWGQHGNRARSELLRFRKLWDVVQVVDRNTKAIIEQITSLEICNWNLEESIIALCQAIGSNRSDRSGIGHMASMSEDRWKKIWAYYAVLRQWLVSRHEVGGGRKSGYRSLLEITDQNQRVQNHVLKLLGSRTRLKELYIELFCLFLEFSIRNVFRKDSVELEVHISAASVLEEEIKKHNPDSSILNALKPGLYEGYLCYDGLELCHHKLFRRFDIILSSIGAEKWRAAMPTKGTDGFDRAKTLEAYLAPIEMWVNSGKQGASNEGLCVRIQASLGERDSRKIFLASLLVSLLRSQQMAARKRAENRTKKRIIE